MSKTGTGMVDGVRDTETTVRGPGRPIKDGGPAISARSRVDGTVLAWCDGAWSGDREKVLVARAVSEAVESLPLPPHRDVTAADGDMVWAVAVLRRVLGPVDWAVAPPVGFDAEVAG